MEIDRKTKTFYFKGDSPKTAQRYYTIPELQDRRWVFEEAARMWQQFAEEYVKKEGGEYGSCIIGDCIKVYALPPRCRYVRSVKIVGEPAFQSGGVKTESSEKVIKWLKEEYLIECWQASGRMD